MVALGSLLLKASHRFMIDLSTYRKMHPEPDGATQTPRVYEKGLETLNDPQAASFLILLPATLRGFGFHDKKWSKLI
jgi:hypothetical protein